MPHDLIFIPVILQVLLTIILYIKLAGAKKKALAAGEVDLKRRGVYDDAWPVSVLKINNCIRSQFEVPVLFYTLIGTLWVLGGINDGTQIIAWIYILSRYAHAYIHTGSNRMPHRLRFFMVGVFAVIALMLKAVYAIAL